MSIRAISMNGAKLSKLCRMYCTGRNQLPPKKAIAPAQPSLRPRAGSESAWRSLPDPTRNRADLRVTVRPPAEHLSIKGLDVTQFRRVAHLSCPSPPVCDRFCRRLYEVYRCETARSLRRLFIRDSYRGHQAKLLGVLHPAYCEAREE
jgi:hypothetical protein